MSTQSIVIPWYRQRRVWLRSLQLTPFFWIAVWFLLNVTILPAWYRRVLVDVEAEFSRIAPPSQAKLIDYERQAIGDQASVTAKYETDLGYFPMREYYDTLLRKSGWGYAGEDNNEIDYCKGHYTASLYRYKDYPGTDYTLWVRVGVTSDCEMKKGGGIAYISVDQLVLLLGFSATFLIPYGVVLGWASTALSEREYLRFINELISKPKSIWDARLWAALSLLVGRQRNVESSEY
jgi:hypothetical protein